VDTSDSSQAKIYLLSETQTAEFLGLSTRTLQGWRLRGCGPAYIKVGGRAVRYRRSDLELWIEERRRESTSDPGPAAQGARS
jgi:predicted DNA-binding transcriptional regulator AlpA